MNFDEHGLRAPRSGPVSLSFGASPALDHDDTIAIVDENALTRDRIADALQHMNCNVESFGHPVEFLLKRFAVAPLCLVTRLSHRTMSGLDIQRSLQHDRWHTSVVFLATDTDLSLAIQAMRLGAVDVLGEPFAEQSLIDAVSRAVSLARTRYMHEQSLNDYEQRVGSLTRREAEVMMLVTQGLLNKQIAATLGISIITTKLHRGRMMKKMRSSRVPELVRIVDALTNAGIALPQAPPEVSVCTEEALST